MASDLDGLAGVLKDQGDFVGSERLFKRALEIYEKELGPNHPETATTLNNLGSALHAQGDSIHAQPLFERALTIYENKLGSQHPYTAATLHNLASTLTERDPVSSLQIHRRALNIHETV